MSRHHLDRLFRAKLNRIDEAPDPAMWIQAKALIDADAKKKKRDRWLFFLFLGILGTIHVGLVYTISSEQPAERQSSNKTEVPLARSERAPDIESLERVEEHESSAKKDLQDLATDPTGRTANSNHIYSDEATKAKEPSASSVDPSREIAKADSDRTSIPRDSQLQPDSSTEDGKASKTGLAESDSSSEPSNDRAHKDQSDPLEEAEGSRQLHLDLAAEPIDIRPANELHWTYSLEQQEKPFARESLFEDTRYRETRIGWTGTLLLNPATQAASPVQGFTLGFTGEYHLSKDWYLGARPSVQLRLNQDGFSKFETLTTFAFEAVSTTYGLKATSLQMISLPVYLGWRKGIHMVDIGGSADLVLAARGRLQQVDVNGQEVTPVENFGSGWIETDAMQGLTLNISGGYKVQLNDRFYSGISFYYFPGPLYPGLPNNLNQKLTSKWHLGLQATYYLK